MSWGWVYVIIAAAFVAMLVGYAVWLWHKATDVYAEVQVLGRRAGQLADVLARLDLRPLEQGPAGRRDPDLIAGEYPTERDWATERDWTTEHDRHEAMAEPWARFDDPEDEEYPADGTRRETGRD